MKSFCSLRATLAAGVFVWTVGLPTLLAAQPAYAINDLGTLPDSPRSRWVVGTKVNETGTVLALAQVGSQNVRRTFVWDDGIGTEVGPFPGEPQATTGVGLNDAGEVAGYSPICTPLCRGHAFLWSNGTMFDIGTLGHEQSVAWDVNRDGDVVGVVFDDGTLRLPFLYSGGVTTQLGLLPNGSEGAAYAINASGQIVGLSSTTGLSGEKIWHAVMWQNGSIVDLHGVATHSLASKMNNAGQAIGVLWFVDPVQGVNLRGFRYSNGIMTDLGSFGGGGSGANDINQLGDVVGWANFPQPGGPGDHAFLYTGTTLIDLGTLGGRHSYARAINSARQVVGYADTSAARHAFLYAGGTMRDLNDLIPPGTGWELGDAFDINEGGQIVGWGLIGGQAHAFRLDPLAN